LKILFDSVKLLLLSLLCKPKRKQLLQRPLRLQLLLLPLLQLRLLR
jgi:hypothetical protein